MKTVCSGGSLKRWLLVGSAVMVFSQHLGASVLGGSTYDGVHYNPNVACCVGTGHGGAYTYAIGAKFTVGGSGSFALTKATLALWAPQDDPNSSNYELAIVGDVNDTPTGDVLWSAAPNGVTSEGNYSFDLTGTVIGGQDYWLLFTPIAPDSGMYLWANCQGWWGDDGSVAERWSRTGPPQGDWVVLDHEVRPAFLVEGTPVVPEPGITSLLLVGMAALARSWQRQQR
jgi:hypothetical protein